MSSTIGLRPVDVRDIRLSRAELALAEIGAARSGVAPREWIRRALVHFDRWQDLWDGPVALHDDQDAELELFATLAEDAPGSLRGQWRHLYEMVRLNDALWMWPPQSIDENDDSYDPSLPYLNRGALARAWPQLRAAVAEVMSAAALRTQQRDTGLASCCPDLGRH